MLTANTNLNNGTQDNSILFYQQKVCVPVELFTEITDTVAQQTFVQCHLIHIRIIT